MLNTELRKSVASFGKSWASVLLPTQTPWRLIKQKSKTVTLFSRESLPMPRTVKLTLNNLIT